MYPQRVNRQRRVLDIEFNFSDASRGGGGRGEGRGGRGRGEGRGGRGGRDRERRGGDKKVNNKMGGGRGVSSKQNLFI